VKGNSNANTGKEQQMKQIKVFKSKEFPKKIVIKLPYSTVYLKKIRQIDTRFWHGKQKVWTIPDNDETIKQFKDLFSN